MTRTLFPEFEVAVGSQKLKSGGRFALWRLEILREVNGGDGLITLPTGPGLGIKLDEDFVKKHKIVNE
jgi:L-alanine-DL-glutamate epimerase-like enolase superfamily enzyme